MIVTTAKDHLAFARTIECPSGFGDDYGRWEQVSEEMGKDIRDFSGDTVEVLRYAQNGLHFDHRRKTDPKVLRNWMAILAYEYPWFFDKFLEMTDDPDSEPDTVVQSHVNSNLLSNMLLWHARSLFTICTHILPKTVVEIGGGYGAFAKLWLTSNIAPCDRYVIVDIPESLFFSEVYLTKCFGDQVGYWNGADPGTKIVLVPLQSLANGIDIGSIDLVISMGSMQEMSDQWVSFFQDWLDKVDAKFFYSMNYAGQPVYEMGESRNLWSPRLSMKWSTRLLNPDPPLVRVMCVERPFMEALYERSPATRSLYDWPGLTGAFTTRASYLEGLDLIRQHPNADTIGLFLKICRNTYRVPAKELLYLAQTMANAGHTEFKALADEYGELVKGYR